MSRLASPPISMANTGVMQRLPPLQRSAAPGTSGTTVASSGTTQYGYGSWTELVAATTTNWLGFTLCCMSGGFGTSAAAEPAVIDIGIGAAGNEVAILAGVDVSGRAGSSAAQNIYFLDVPYLFIPSGTRVSARVATSTLNKSAALVAHPYTAGATKAAPPVTATDALVTVSNARGTSVTAGAGWTQLVAATTRYYRGILIGQGNNDSSTGTANAQTFEVAFGAAGGEVVVGSWLSCFSSAENLFLSGSTFLPIPVRVGTRIAARCSTETQSATVHGFY